MPDYTLSAKATFDGSNFNSGVSKSASALDKFKSKCDSVSSKTSGSFGKIVKAATGITTALAGIGTGLILKGGIDRALNIEQAQYKLKQMGMDVQEVMNSVNAAAKGTKFGLGSVATVASSLGASGVEAGEQMTNALKTITGMATLSGRSVEDIGLIFGKVAAQGKIQGDELMQFSESGLNVTKALAEHLGVAQSEISELAKKGQIDFQTFADAMQKAYGEAAYGANDTFIGSLENVKSALSRLGEKFAKPALEGLKGVFQNTIPAVDALTASLDPAANKFGEFATNIGERVSSGLQKFVEVLNQTQSPLQAFKAMISETFGAEWGGAINAFVDAFSSVGSVIKDVIQWFVSLDSGTQLAIAQFVAFGAAIRPIVSLVASVGSKLASFAQGAARVGTFFGNIGSQGIVASTGLNKVGTAAKSAKQHISVMATEGTKFKTLAAYANSSAVSFRQTGVAAQSSSKSVSAFAKSAASSVKGLSAVTAGLNVLKGALASIGTGLLVGAAFAGIGMAIATISDQMEKARVHSENLEKATTGLVSATRNVPAGAAASSAALDKMSTSSQQAAKSTQELLEAQANIAESMAQRNEATAAEISTLKGYQEALAQFNGQQLNEEGVARFKLLVDEMNKSLGTTYEVGQNAQGAYVLMADGAEVATQSVHDLIEAKMLEAQLDNAKSNYADAKKAEADAAADLAKNTKELSTFEERRNELLHKRGPLTQDETRELGELNGRYNELTQNISDAQKMYDAAAESTKAWEDQMVMAQEAMDANADSYTQLVGKNQSLMASLASCGQSSTQFRDQLRELGYDTNELANITDEQWAQIAATYDGTKESIVKGLNDIGVQSEEAARRAQEAVQGMTDAFGKLGEGANFEAFAQSFGMSAAQMTEQLQQWGITAEEISNITADSFKSMSEKAGMSITDLASHFEAAGVTLPESVNAMVQSIDAAKQSFSDLTQGADFSKFAQSLGIGMDEAAATFTEKCGQLGEVSAQTVQQMADAFGTSKESIAAALSAAGVTIPEEVRKWGEGAQPAAQETGQSIGEGVNEGASQGATDGGETVVQGILDTAQGHEGEFTSIGQSLGNSLSTGFAQADMMSTQTALTNLFLSLSTRTAELMAIGTSWGNALSTGFAMADMMSTQTSITMLIANLSMRSVELMAIGVSWGNALSTGFATADMMSTAGAVTMFIANLSARSAELTAIGVSWGNALSTGFSTADMMSSGAAIQSFIGSLAGYEGQFNSQGVSYGNALSTGFASADMASAAAAISSLVSMISGHEGEFTAAGNAAGMAYASGFSSSNIAGAASVVSSLLGAVNGMAGSFMAAGIMAGNSYTSGFSSANTGGAVQMVQNVLSQIQGMVSQFTQAGTDAGNGYASGLSAAGGNVSSAAASYNDLVSSALSGVAGSAFSYGSHVGSQFAAGISSQAGAVASAAASLAAAAKANIGHSKPKEGPLRMGEEIFGRHLAQNFANGIIKGTFFVTRATKGIAQTVVDYLGHSKPIKGPLSKGEHIFGQHAMENFADGIKKGGSEVEKQAEAIAQIVFDYIGHSNPSKGPLSPGEWVFGVHTATNYAAGLGSAEAIDAVTGAVEDLADAAKKAWDASLLAAYKTRSDEIKAITSDLADFMGSAFSDVFAADKFTSARGNGKGVFGLHEEIYTTLEAIHKAGYNSLQEWQDKEKELNERYIKDQQEYAEGVAEYESKVYDIYDDANRQLRDALENRNDQLSRGNGEAWKIERDYNEKVEDILKRRDEQLNSTHKSWLENVDAIAAHNREFEEFNKLKDSFATQNYLWLKENEQLFNFQYEIEIGDDKAKRALNNLAQLSQKTGVVFTESFVKRITEGSEEAMSLLSNLANATSEDVKQMSEAWYDYEQLQRMQEQSTRELWVNSLKYTQTGTQQLRDLLLNYKDTVLDVKEAVYSDAGLSGAFEKAGVSIEGFALDLESVGLTMDDFTKNFTNFTSQVSNGFRAMDSFSQTSLSEWKDNLRQNMAESQAFANNVAKVFNSIPSSVDSDLFRKAVLQGGFDEWGHIMADLAKASSSEIESAIRLYNEAINEAQQSAIEQFRAMAPGEEYMDAFMEGVIGQKGELTDSTLGMLVEVADSTGNKAYSQWVSVGEYMAAGLEHGIYGQVNSIADAAAAVVRQAIAAAQAEAQIASPSRKTIWLGQMLDRGLAVGMDKYSGLVAKSAASLVDIPGEAINGLPDLPNYSINTSASHGIHDVGGSTSYTYGDVIVNAQVSNDIDMRKLGREIARFQNHRGKIRGLS